MEPVGAGSPEPGIVKARASIGGFRHPRHMSYNPSSHSFCTTLRWPGDSHALSQSRRNVAFRLISQQNNRDYYSVCGRLDKRMMHACNVCYLTCMSLLDIGRHDDSACSDLVVMMCVSWCGHGHRPCAFLICTLKVC